MKDIPIELVENLVTCIEQLMPGAGHCVVDVGLLNDTLMEANALIRSQNDDEEQ